MRALPASSLFVIIAAAGSTAAQDEAPRSHRFSTTGIEHLHIDHRAGELILAPADGDQIEVELRIEAEEGRELKGDLADLDLTFSVRGNRLTLRFDEPDVRSHMLVRLPPLEQLTIDAGYGEVQGTLPPMRTDVKLKAGTVNLDVDGSSTGHIDLRALVGDTAVDGARNAETNRVLLVGSSSSAAGQGSRRVDARVRAGDIRVGHR